MNADPPRNLEVYTAIFVGLYLATWIAAVINTVVMKRFFASRYRDAAKEIFPGILNKSISSDILGLRYIASRGYTAIDDPAFVKRMDLHRTILLITIALITSGLITGMFLIFPH